MKYLILEVVNSTQPLYLNIDQIAYFADRQGRTAVTLKDGREFITPWAAKDLHANLVALQGEEGSVQRATLVLSGIKNSLQELPTVVAQEFFVQRRINRGWLPSLLRRWGII